jgi:hypothetical protein
MLLAVLAGTSSAQLSTGFYSYSCPGVYDAVKSVMQAAIAREQRMGASILRLFFHDCFVQVITNTTNNITQKYYLMINLITYSYLFIIRNFHYSACRVATRRCCWMTRPVSRARRWRRPTTAP